MAVWSTAYVNSLPNSSFAWIDSSGGRHLPYKDKNGKIDKAHTRNALARLNQVKGMPAGTRKSVRTKLERALNRANNMSEIFNYVDVRQFGDVSGDKLITFQAWPYGSWDHPLWGEINFDEDMGNKFIKNFTDGVLGTDLHIDYSHKSDFSKGDKAAGWVKAITLDESGMNYTVDLTPQARQEIQNKEWRYFSPSYRTEWESPVTGIVHDYVLTGGGLTNQPFLKGIAPLNFSEVAGWEHQDSPVDQEKEQPSPISPPHPMTDQEENPNVVNNLSETFKSGGIYHVKLSNMHTNTSFQFNTTMNADNQWQWYNPHPIPAGTYTVPWIYTDTTSTKGGEKTVDEKQLRELFGIGAEVDLSDFFKELKKDHESLKELKDSVNADRQFAEKYPEQARELEEARKFRIETEARTFSEKYTKNSESKGFAPATTEIIQTKYPELSPSARVALAEVLDSILEKGFVDYKEHGTSFVPDILDDDEDATSKVQAKIREFQENDKMDFSAAYIAAQKALPEEFAKYVANRRTLVTQAGGE